MPLASILIEFHLGSALQHLRALALYANYHRHSLWPYPWPYTVYDDIQTPALPRCLWLCTCRQPLALLRHQPAPLCNTFTCVCHCHLWHCPSVPCLPIYLASPRLHACRPLASGPNTFGPAHDPHHVMSPVGSTNSHMPMTLHMTRDHKTLGSRPSLTCLGPCPWPRLSWTHDTLWLHL